MREEPEDTEAIADSHYYYRSGGSQARTVVVGFETPATLVTTTV